MSHVTASSIWRHTACVDCAKVFGYRIEGRLGRLPMCRCFVCAARIYAKKVTHRHHTRQYRGF